MSASQEFKQAAEQKISFRFSEPSDVTPLMEFYSKTQHKDVDKRPIALVQKQIEQGRALIVEKDGEIISSSIGYDYKSANDNSSNATWIEFGSTISAESTRGMGLYPFIIASQAVYEFMKNPPSDAFIGAIYHTATGVFDMLSNKVGWKEFLPSDELQDVADLRKDMDHLHCLHTTSDLIPRQARLVDVFMQNATITHKKTKEVFTLDFSKFPLANELRPQLEELARGDFGKTLEQSPPIPLAAANALMAEHMRKPGPGANPSP